MKMPTKAELLRLQELYHTDKRIAEALGGNVTEHLVQYWRRKKGIERRKFPKYSEAQIRELWERYGDDFRCGRELDLSKAGFYSWRRRYNIMDKPHALRLEQLELRFGAEPKLGRDGVYVEYYRTVAEKIIARCSESEIVERKQTVELTPDLILLTGANGKDKRKIRISKSIADRVWFVSTNRSVTSDSPIASDRMLDNTFSLLHSEELSPNTLIVRDNCTSAAYSAFSSLSIQLRKDQLNKLLKTGKFEYTVPPVLKLTLQGRLQRGVTAFDIFCYAVSNVPQNVFDGRIVEYSGNVAEKLNMFERFSLCHLTPFSGAACGYTLFDETTRKYLFKRGKSDHKALFSDSKAYYDRDYVLMVSGLTPQIVKSNDLRSGQNVGDTEDIGSIDTVFVGGPCGGGIEAIKQLADLFKERKVNPSVRMYVSPLTQEIYVEAIKKRYLAPIAEAGVTILPPASSLEDIPQYVPDSAAIILATPFRCDGSPPPNCWYVSHFTAAESAVQGKLSRVER